MTALALVVMATGGRWVGCEGCETVDPESLTVMAALTATQESANYTSGGALESCRGTHRDAEEVLSGSAEAQFSCFLWESGSF